MGFGLNRLLILSLMLFYACQMGEGNAIRIGSKIDTEGVILGYIQLTALSAQGFPVEDRIETGPTLIVRRALEYGELDGYIEYTGTALVNFMGVSDPAILSSPSKGYRRLQLWDEQNHGLVWLDPWSGINNTYTVLLSDKTAKRLQLKTISDFSEYLQSGHQLTFGSDPEFAARPDGLQGLREHYGFGNPKLLNIKQLDSGLMYQNLAVENLDAGIGYSTDGRIAALNLFRLKDDRHFFPVYNPTPVYRREILSRYPGLEAALNRIAGLITAEAITQMNFRHDVDRIPAPLLAREWVENHPEVLGKPSSN